MESVGIILINGIIGVLIGISGIGGFFLPLYYINVLGAPLKESLSMSFSAFLVSGVIGSISYIKERWITKFPAIPLALSCLIGSMIGVQLSDLVPEKLITTTLYTITLLSGISLFKQQKTHSPSALLEKPIFWVVSGLIVGIICSMSGVGGALLLVPVLAFLGMQLPSAVGLGIMASIFVSIPAIIGYFLQTGGVSLTSTFALAMGTHGIGVIVGAKVSNKIHHSTLKYTIGVIAVISAGLLLVTQFL